MCAFDCDTRRLQGTRAEHVRQAVELLRHGGVVAFPTETVYGLGGDGMSARVVEKIYAAKNRPADNPLILHAGSVQMVWQLCQPDAKQRKLAALLADNFWPGPLTLVLPAAPVVPARVTASLPTVALRIPDHPLALHLIRELGRPLAAPSANISGRPSPTCAAHVLRTLSGRIDAVLDAGDTRVGLESTVVQIRDQEVHVLRAGGITRLQLEAVLTPHAICISSAQPSINAPPRAPGCAHPHYVPAGLDVRLISATQLAQHWQGNAAILCRQSLANMLGYRQAPLQVLPDTPRDYARQLYAALYAFEETGARRLLVERLPDADPNWQAALDRLARAAGS